MSLISLLALSRKMRDWFSTETTRADVTLKAVDILFDRRLWL